MKVVHTYDLSNSEDRYEYECSLQSKRVLRVLIGMIQFLNDEIRTLEYSSDKCETLYNILAKLEDSISNNNVDTDPCSGDYYE
jgi:hypothetical protein